MIKLNITALTALMPGATETQFARVSGMDKTNPFRKPFSARAVAEGGYYGMMKRKLDVIAGVTGTHKVMMSMLPVMPKRIK